jgi:hypothetical protein
MNLRIILVDVSVECLLQQSWNYIWSGAIAVAGAAAAPILHLIN